MMTTPIEESLKINEELHNIYVNVRGTAIDESNYYIDNIVVEEAMDTLESLNDECTHTYDEEFNKLAEKLIKTAGTFLLYYYQRTSPFIDKLTYQNKFRLDRQSIGNIADFFLNKYVLNEDCYLVWIESDINDMLQFPFKKGSDALAIPHICLFNRGECIKIKHISDNKYTSFNYNPSELISTVKFTRTNGEIKAEIDNSVWTDEAWGQTDNLNEESPEIEKEENMDRATQIYNEISTDLESAGLKLIREEEKFILRCYTNVKNVPVSFVLYVSGQQEMVTFFSALPLQISEDKCVDMALAVCKLNRTLTLGRFDYNISGGTIEYTHWVSYRDCYFDDKFFAHIVLIALSNISSHFDDLYQLNKGYIDLDEFLEN